MLESLGFDELWLSEHHFFYDGYCPALLPAAASALASTERIRVGTGVLLAPLQDPDRVVRIADQLVQSYGPRIDIGLGLGYRDPEFDGKGILRSERVARHEALCSRLENAGFGVVVGTSTTAGARRAGRHGRALIMSGATPIERARDLRSAQLDGWAQSGTAQSRPGFVLMRNTWIVRSEAEREAVLSWLRASYVLYAGLGWAMDAQGEHSAMDFRAEVEDALDKAVGTAIVGDADHVASALAAMADIDASQIVCRVMLEGASRVAQQRFFMDFSADVMSRLSPRDRSTDA